MKKALLILIFLVPILSWGQKYDSLNNYGFSWNRGAFRSQLNIPFVDTVSPSPIFLTPGAIVMRPADSGMYVWLGDRWTSLGGVSGGSTLQEVTDAGNETDNTLMLTNEVKLSDGISDYLHQKGATDITGVWINLGTKNNWLGDSTGAHAGDVDSVVNSVGFGDKIFTSLKWGVFNQGVGTYLAPRMERLATYPNGNFNNFSGGYILPNVTDGTIHSNILTGVQIMSQGSATKWITDVVALTPTSGLDECDTCLYTIAIGRQTGEDVTYSNGSQMIGNEAMRHTDRTQNAVGLGYKAFFGAEQVYSSVAIGSHAAHGVVGQTDEIVRSTFIGTFEAAEQPIGTVENLLVVGYRAGNDITTEDSCTVISGVGHGLADFGSNQLVIEDVLEGYKDVANRHMNVTNDTVNIYNDASLGIRVAGGNINTPSLAGSGIRAVTADANGWLGSATLFTLPSLTSGSVIFSNGTTLAQDNTNFFWDDTNDRLGLGVSSPSQRLHIRGVSENVSAIRIDNGAATFPLYAQTYSSGYAQFQGNAAWNGSAYVRTVLGAATLFRMLDGSSGGGNFAFETAPSGAAGSSAAFTQRLKIYQDGRVTVGTSDNFTVNASGYITEYSDVVPTNGMGLVGNTANNRFNMVALNDVSATAISVTGGLSLTSPNTFRRVNAGVTVTVTPAYAGQTFTFKQVGVGTVTVQMASGNIDGAATTTLLTDNEAKNIFWDGTNAYLY